MSGDGEDTEKPKKPEPKQAGDNSGDSSQERGHAEAQDKTTDILRTEARDIARKTSELKTPSELKPQADLKSGHIDTVTGKVHEGQVGAPDTAGRDASPNKPGGAHVDATGDPHETEGSDAADSPSGDTTSGEKAGKKDGKGNPSHERNRRNRREQDGTQLDLKTGEFVRPELNSNPGDGKPGTPGKGKPEGAAEGKPVDAKQNEVPNPIPNPQRNSGDGATEPNKVEPNKVESADSNPKPTATDAEPQPVAIDANPQAGKPVAVNTDTNPQANSTEAKPKTPANDASPVAAGDNRPVKAGTDADPQATATDAKPKTATTDGNPQTVATEAKPKPIATDAQPQTTTSDAKPVPAANDAKPPVTADATDSNPQAAVGAKPAVARSFNPATASNPSSDRGFGGFTQSQPFNSGKILGTGFDNTKPLPQVAVARATVRNGDQPTQAKPVEQPAALNPETRSNPGEQPNAGEQPKAEKPNSGEQPKPQVEKPITGEQPVEKPNSGDQPKPQTDKPVPQNKEKPADSRTPAADQFSGFLSPELPKTLTAPQAQDKPQANPQGNPDKPQATQEKPTDANPSQTLMPPKMVKTESFRPDQTPQPTNIINGDQASTFTPNAMKDVPITTVPVRVDNAKLDQPPAQQGAPDQSGRTPQQQMYDMAFSSTPADQQKVELQPASAGAAGDQNSGMYNPTFTANRNPEASGSAGADQPNDAAPSSGSSANDRSGASNTAMDNYMFNTQDLAHQNPQQYDQSGAGSAGEPLQSITKETYRTGSDDYAQQSGGNSLGNEGPSTASFGDGNSSNNGHITIADAHPSSGSGNNGDRDNGYDVSSSTSMAEQGGYLNGGATGQAGDGNSRSGGIGTQDDGAGLHGSAVASAEGLTDGYHKGGGQDGQTSLADQGSASAHAGDSTAGHGNESAGYSSSVAHAGGESNGSTFSRSTSDDSGSQPLSRSTTEVASNRGPSSAQDSPDDSSASPTTGDTTKSDLKLADASRTADTHSPSASSTLERNVLDRTAQPSAQDTADVRPNIIASADKDINDGQRTTQERLDNITRMAAAAVVSMEAPRSPGQVNVSDNQGGRTSFPVGSDINLARNSAGSLIGTPIDLARSTVDGAKGIMAGNDRFAGAVSLSTLSGKGTDGILGLSTLHGQINRVNTDGRIIGNPGQFSALTSGKGLFGENKTFIGPRTDGFNHNPQNQIGGRLGLDGRIGGQGVKGGSIDGKGIRSGGFDQQLVGPIGIPGSKLSDRTLTFKNGRLDYTSGGKRYLTGVEIALAAALAAAAIAKKRPEDQLDEEGLAEGQLSELLEDNDGHLQKDTRPAKDSTLARQSVSNLFKRPVHLVQPNESLISIAEDYFNDSDVAWLIADINLTNIIEHFEEGKRIIELRSRQEIQLPLPSEITEFFSTKKKEHRGDLIVTIIADSQIDAELLNNFLGTVVGVAHSAQTPEHSAAAPSAVPDFADIPQASFQDETLSAIRNFGKSIMPTVHALLNSGKNLRTFISKVEEVPPTPTSPANLKAVENDKITA